MGDKVPLPLWNSIDEIALMVYLLNKPIVVISMEQNGNVKSVDLHILVDKTYQLSKRSRMPAEDIKAKRLIHHYLAKIQDGKLFYNLKSNSPAVEYDGFIEKLHSNEICVIIYLNGSMHYNSIYSKDRPTSNDFIISTWDRVTYNPWTNPCVKLCPECRKSSRRAEIQCDVCDWWVHPDCISEKFKGEYVNENAFACTLCTKGIEMDFKKVSTEKNPVSFHMAVQWFLSFQIMNDYEDVEKVQFLTKIIRGMHHWKKYISNWKSME